MGRVSSCPDLIPESSARTLSWSLIAVMAASPSNRSRQASGSAKRRCRTGCVVDLEERERSRSGCGRCVRGRSGSGYSNRTTRPSVVQQRTCRRRTCVLTVPRITYPLVAELADARIFRDGVVPGPQARKSDLLSVERDPAGVLRACWINWLHDAHHDDPTSGYRYFADKARRTGANEPSNDMEVLPHAGVFSSVQRRRRGKGKKAGPARV